MRAWELSTINIGECESQHERGKKEIRMGKEGKFYMYFLEQQGSTECLSLEASIVGMCGSLENFGEVRIKFERKLSMADGWWRSKFENFLWSPNEKLKENCQWPIVDGVRSSTNFGEVWTKVERNKSISYGGKEDDDMEK